MQPPAQQQFNSQTTPSAIHRIGALCVAENTNPKTSEPKRYTDADILALEERVELLTSKVYQRVNQLEPGSGHVGTIALTDGVVTKDTPVDYRLTIIPVTVQGYGYTALFDTGSMITLAPIALAYTLKIPLEDCNKTITSVTGHSVDVTKKALVQLTIARHRREVEIHFTALGFLGSKNPYDFIIGIDTICLLPAFALDAANRKLTVGNNTISWKTKAEQEREKRKVFLTHKLIIPPNSGLVVNAVVDKSRGEVTKVMTIEKSDSHPIEVTHAVIEVDEDYRCKIALSNPYSAEIKLRSYTVIGHAANILDDGLFSNTNATIPANTRNKTTDTGDPVERRSKTEYFASLLGSSSAADRH
jgi:hypothetical protein